MTNFCQDFFDDFGRLYFARDAHCKRSQKFHRDILYAIRDQNAGVARDVMRDVLAYAERAVYDALDQATATESGGGLSF
jgi:DNA-binding FadR family transcriptional regulator